MAEKDNYPPLSDREFMIISAVMNNPVKGLYGADIRKTVKEEFGVNIALGSLYVTLGRLVEKGFLERVEGAAIEGMDNLRRQYYRATHDGVAVVRAKAALLSSLPATA